jgi:hypothetical protein
MSTRGHGGAPRQGDGVGDSPECHGVSEAVEIGPARWYFEAVAELQ